MPDCLQQLHGIKVENILPVRTIPEYLVVPGKAKDIIYVKRGRPEDIALQSDPVPVASDHLQDGLHPISFKWMQAAETGEIALTRFLAIQKSPSLTLTSRGRPLGSEPGISI